MTKRKTKRKKQRLTDLQKAFVVQRLACWDTPKEAAEALMAEYGIDLAPQNCEAYDPNKFAGRSLAKKWRELFEITRKRFLKHVETHVPEANKAVRIRRLSHAARAFRDRGNYVGEADMLERIAKECGNVHTNRRELTGKDGGPIKYQDVDSMTDDELDAELRRHGYDPNVHPSHATEQ